MGALSEQVVLVTGASRGIGAATARVLSEAGARVIITHRDSAAGAEEVLAGLTGDGHRIVQVSATDSDGLRAAAASVAEIEGRLDILVNNAAASRVVPHRDLDALDDELFDKILAEVHACVGDRAVEGAQPPKQLPATSTEDG